MRDNFVSLNENPQVRASRRAVPSEGKEKDPPHTRQSAPTLAAFRPWGSSAR